MSPPINILSFDEKIFCVNFHHLSKRHLSLSLGPNILKPPPGLNHRFLSAFIASVRRRGTHFADTFDMAKCSWIIVDIVPEARFVSRLI